MKQLSLILLCTVFGWTSLLAQPVSTPRNMALGGGGSTYITDYHANFYNPANLMIQDRRGDFSFGFGIGTFSFDAFRNYINVPDQLQNGLDHLRPYTPGTFPLSNEERLQLLADHYPRRTTLSDNRARYDLTLIGMKWVRNTHSFSIALRTRSSSSFRVGKGWYSTGFQQNNEDEQVLNRSLIHRYQSFHEISFGYAESFQFLTGLTPRLDNFIIGIAPKLVLGGSYQVADWKNIYTEGNEITRTQKFRYNATGDFEQATLDYLNGTPLSTANDRAFSATDLSIQGIGAGLDIGVTYLITLGSDLSAVRPDQQPTQSSLRLSFSMTDIGFISYNDKTLVMSAERSTSTVTNAPAIIAGETFSGTRGQYLSFLEQYAEDSPLDSLEMSTDAFSTLLPMAVHTGALLELNRLKVMGDWSVGLTNNAFNSTKLVTSLGLEIRPLTFLPLRGGISFRAQRPDYISFGTAIETRKWDLSFAAIFTPDSMNSKPTVRGFSVATFQFRF